MADLTQAWVPASWRRRSLTRNVVIGWAATLLNAALAFALTPLIVATLDKELYGVWTFLNSFIIYSNLLYLGLGAAFMKRFSDAVGHNDIATQTRLLGVATSLYTGIGLVCVVIALALSPIVPDMFGTPLTPAAARAASITMALFGFRLLFAVLGTAFTALMASHGRWDLVTGVGLVAAAVRTGAVLWSLTLPNPLIALGVVTVVETALVLPVFVWICRMLAPDVRLRPVIPTVGELRSLYAFGFQAFFVQMSLLIITYTDTALIGVLLGPAAVTMYALPLQLVDYSRVLVNGITQSLLPELAGLKVRGDFVGLKKVFLRVSRASAAMSVFINVHLVVLGPAFLALWMGPQFTEDAFEILLFLAIAATIGAVSTQVLIPFYQALDVLKVLVGIVLAEAVLNIGLSAWLATSIGVWGVALASAIPAAAITMVLAPKYMLPRLDVGTGEYLWQVAVPAVALAAVCVVTQNVLSLWLGVDSYAVMAVRVAISGVAVAPVVVMTFPRHEWLPIVARMAPGLAARL
jgi:O-antigen/teichoic acid export membrane protein